MQPSPQAQGRGGQQSQHAGQSRSAYLPCLFSPHSLGFQSATPILLSPSLVSSTPFLLPFSPAVLFLVSNLQRGLYLRARGASPASPTEQVKDVCISSSIYSAAPAGGRLRVLSPSLQPIPISGTHAGSSSTSFSLTWILNPHANQGKRWLQAEAQRTRG